ncbi:hypothetical protein F5Y08DRAFT_297889 [Xylaria arbuscula]|nr:hypothetical protein F5Y08DRAFT_297889 [Xylaria arbuscula]
MAEISRAAQAAMRSTTASLIRTAPIPLHSCRHFAIATTVSKRNHMSTASNSHVSALSPYSSQQRPYSSFNWGNPSRPARTLDNIADLDVKKPQSSSYDFAFRGKTEDEQSSDPVQDFASDLEFTDLHPNNKLQSLAPTAPRAQMRLVARTGRTVHVGNNVDVARSFKLLAVQVGQNKVRREFNLQRFHERPGKKRKRLRSERWQARFRKGFKATISRVRELTAQGW